jgi:SAM-dependent methyltransferase
MELESTRGDGLFPAPYFTRVDESEDPLFYAYPRKVVHIDDDAIAAVGQLYAQLLPREGRFLDLMSSWRTHLPQGFDAGQVVGLGMNGEEMADNPQLNSYVIQDLNHHPQLPFGNSEFDGAMCAVSVQYLLHPVLVFREVHRIIRPSSPFIVTFSNRCFPTKAVALWRSSSNEQHLVIVRSYFAASAPWEEVTAEDRSSGTGSDPLYGVWARKAGS